MINDMDNIEPQNILTELTDIRQKFSHIADLVNSGCEVEAKDELNNVKALIDDIIAHLMAFE